MNVGVLALQGDFEAHQRRLTELGAKTIQVRKAIELQAVSGLVLPGGESSTMLKLMPPHLREALTRAVRGGMAIFATCAGVILLAKNVSQPRQESLDLLDVDVTRNAYGRQIDSFQSPSVPWTTSGRQVLEQAQLPAGAGVDTVFIRAPIITRVGSGAQVLLEREEGPVLVKQQNILAATFHPELTDDPVVHQLFLKMAAGLCPDRASSGRA